MARYVGFVVLSCVFTIGVVAMVKTHRLPSSPPPQVVASQSAN